MLAKLLTGCISDCCLYIICLLFYGDLYEMCVNCVLLVLRCGCVIFRRWGLYCTGTLWAGWCAQIGIEEL